jgi:hypothetical protein
MRKTSGERLAVEGSIVFLLIFSLTAGLPAGGSAGSLVFLVNPGGT